ncbi:hypothetical protein RZS08_59890, partial [Arthrospira platensis SPKY1]|nr:hypothetical protein [Arthrospira platensis SPKY1]
GETGPEGAGQGIGACAARGPHVAVARAKGPSLPMKDSRILSSFQELPHAAGARPMTEMPALRQRDLVFDTCQVGVVLRTVVFVQSVVLVAA